MADRSTRINLENTFEQAINPATEDKQDSIIATLGGDSANDLLLDDTTTANVIYVGEAAIGSATASAVWRIKKINEINGLTLGWADSNTNFDNIWDNRVSLTYSQ